ncbi:MAG: hypothetical protein GTO55_05510 [Armatimonadetes bacterium]|nr:hypothetical protein [Armatimonadota bacterium]NIM23715.1 hypothetical protein [Armatimonadota bacterium]NIM67592.1 hypothetical protein [Armatimonadota bacterium]NIM76115.1 hypothetical protein [Armatimonadota bacterium]NIN05798.1 hypothetical protein [Armatimonadota bacterium]
MADAAAAAANKKKILIIAGVAALLVIVLVIVFAGRGKKTAEDPGSGATSQAKLGARRGRGAARRRAEERGLVETAEPAAAAATATAEIEPVIYPGEPEPIRADPFVVQKPPPKPPPPPAPPVLPAVAPMAGGIRVTRDGDFATLRRTAGIMWNGEVYGLLQLGAETYIVRPGDTVREYTVNAITRDSIILYSPILRRQIQVPLQGPRSRMPEQVVTGASAEAYALGGESSMGLGFEELEEVPEGFEEMPEVFEEPLEWVEEELVPALPELPPE